MSERLRFCILDLQYDCIMLPRQTPAEQVSIMKVSIIEAYPLRFQPIDPLVVKEPASYKAQVLVRLSKRTTKPLWFNTRYLLTCYFFKELVDLFSSLILTRDPYFLVIDLMAL